jgi:hypothetical protein
MEYTHNIKIILLDDKNSNIIEDEPILNEIKNILSRNHTHKMEWNGRFQNFTIKWDKIILSDVNKYLMGDLFSFPIYDSDSIVLRHTEETISKIECKYIVKFYISRIIGDKKIDINSIGLV